MTFEQYERDMNDQAKMEKLRMETAAAMKHSAEWVVFSVHAVVDSLKVRCSYANLPKTDPAAYNEVCHLAMLAADRNEKETRGIIEAMTMIMKAHSIEFEDVLRRC